jgi:hypothetical protein
MKKFTDYLTESKKTYEFKIGIAGELPEGFDNSLETALQKFGLVKVTAGKKTPIQERPLDFPQLENTEVTYWEAEVSYPTTPLALQEYLGHCCDVPRYNVIVRNPNEPQELYQEEKEETEYEVKLTKEEMEGESAQSKVGGNHVMDLLKELEAARKERANDYIGDAPVGESKDIGDTENSKSVVGG